MRNRLISNTGVYDRSLESYTLGHFSEVHYVLIEKIDRSMFEDILQNCSLNQVRDASNVNITDIDSRSEQNDKSPREKSRLPE
jgi:hypothetical protein